MELTTAAIDSPDGRWAYHAWRPPRLRGLVDELWHFEGRVAVPRERTFPGGHADLILHLDARYREVSADGAALGHFPVACVNGVPTAPLVVEAPAAPDRVLGVGFRPAGAYRVLGRPMHLLRDVTLDAGDVAGRDAAALAERCDALPTVTARFACVAAWIERRLAVADRGSAAVAWIAAQLERSDGGAGIGALRDATGLTATRLAAAFRDEVGLTPKRYARVLRFRRALDLLQRGAPLSDAALAAGYYDQPHMHADFVEFAGMTPGAFVAARRFPNSPSLQEPG